MSRSRCLARLHVPDWEPRPRVSAVTSTMTTASNTKAGGRESSQPATKSSKQPNGVRSRQNSRSVEKATGSGGSRPGSLAQLASSARIAPEAPIILFMGGPGGGKTRYAAQLQESLRDEGLVHICMPDLVRNAIARYKDRLPEWRLAAERYQRGELIPNELAQQLVKAEMGRHAQAKAYFLEGFPREARQVEDFERNVRPVDMALILDYDETVLRRHMQSRGLLSEVIDRRINEFKQKTLPSAKYFDDQHLLHLIPGEKEDAVIIERMRKLVMRALRTGVGGGAVAQAQGGTEAAATVVASAASSSNSSAGKARRASAKNEETEKAAAAERDDGSPANTKNGSTRDAIGSSSSAAIADTDKGTKDNGVQGSAASTTGRRLRSGSAAATPVQKAPMAQDSAPKTGSAPTDRGKGTSPSSSAAASDKGKRASSGSLRKSKQQRDSKGSAEGSQTPQSRESSSTATTPKPSEGPFRNALQTPQTEIGGAELDDPFPKGLPSDAPVIMIIGAPGSNKSMFAQRIAKKYDGFIHVSLGDLLRRNLLQNGDDELWARIGKKMDVGDMIPMRICRELLYTAIHERGQNSWGYVLEGYPRTLAQAEDVEAQLGRLDLAILIDCTEQFCRDSLSKRFQKDKEEGVERPGDEEDVIKMRLSLFKVNTLPMLKYLDDKNLLRVIEGDTNEDKVFQEICTLIENTIFIQDDGEGQSLNSSKQNSAEESHRVKEENTNEKEEEEVK